MRFVWILLTFIIIVSSTGHARADDPLAARFARALLTDDAAAAETILSEGLSVNARFGLDQSAEFSLLGLSVLFQATRTRDLLLSKGADASGSDGDAYLLAVTVMDASAFDAFAAAGANLRPYASRLVGVLAEPSPEVAATVRESFKQIILNQPEDKEHPTFHPVSHPYWATTNDDPEIKITAVLIDSGAGSNELRTLGAAAAKRGDVLLVEYLRSRGVDIPDNAARNSDLLGAAARAGNVVGVQRLLDLGVEPSQADAEGNIALSEAIQHGHADVAKLLLARGADPDSAGPKQHSALALAARARDADLLDLLLSKAVKLDEVDGSGDWALREAVRAGWDYGMRRLLASGADPNLHNSRGESALHDFRRSDESSEGSGDSTRLLSADHFSCVRYLGSVGFNFNAVDARGRSILDSVLQPPVDYSLLAALTERSTRIDEQSLETALNQIDPELLAWLFDHGGNPNATINGHPLAAVAADLMYRQSKLLAVALKAGATLPSDISKDDLVVRAAESDDNDLVEQLLKAGAEANARGIGGSAVEIALKHGNASMLNLLLTSTDPYDEDGQGRSMLHRLVEADAASADPTIFEGQEQAIAVLLEHGFDLAKVDKEGNTVLQLAQKRERTVKQLLRGVGLARVQDTPLHKAVRENQFAIASDLATKQAIDSLDGMGRSPLTLALQLGNAQAATMLLQRGAYFTKRPRSTAQVADTWYASFPEFADAFQIPLLRQQLLYLDANDSRDRPDDTLTAFNSNDVIASDLVWEVQCRACGNVGGNETTHILKGNQTFDIWPSVVSERGDTPHHTWFRIKEENFVPFVFHSKEGFPILEVFQIRGTLTIPKCEFDFKTKPTCYPGVKIANLTEATTLTVDIPRIGSIPPRPIPAWLTLPMTVTQGATSAIVEPGSSALFDRSLGELKIVAGPQIWPTFAYNITVDFDSGPEAPGDDFLLPARMACYARIAAYKDEFDEIMSDGGTIKPSSSIRAKDLRASINFLSAMAVKRQYRQNVIQLLARAARDIVLADDSVHELTSALIAKNAFTPEQIDLIVAQLDALEAAATPDQKQEFEAAKSALRELRNAKDSQDRELQNFADRFRTSLGTLISDYQGLILEAAQYYSSTEILAQMLAADLNRGVLRSRIKPWEVKISDATASGRGQELRSIFGLPDPQ
jgi:ankyrin repeat protein